MAEKKKSHLLVSGYGLCSYGLYSYGVHSYGHGRKSHLLVWGYGFGRAGLDERIELHLKLLVRDDRVRMELRGKKRRI